MRLHLKGLEGIQVSSGMVAFDATVSSHTGDKPQVRQSKEGKEDSPLDSTSPLWMEIRMVGGDGKTAKDIPLFSDRL